MISDLKTILMAGSVAGILDLSGAFVLVGTRGISPTKILQGIASGVRGVQSYAQGFRTALLGGALHFLIASSTAAVYLYTTRRIKLLTRCPILAGLLYGIPVYAVMNGVVLPLSAFAPKRAVSL